MKAAIEDIAKQKLVDISLSEVINVPVKGRVPKTIMDSGEFIRDFLRFKLRHFLSF